MGNRDAASGKPKPVQQKAREWWGNLGEYLERIAGSFRKVNRRVT